MEWGKCDAGAIGDDSDIWVDAARFCHEERFLARTFLLRRTPPDSRSAIRLLSFWCPLTAYEAGISARRRYGLDLSQDIRRSEHHFSHLLNLIVYLRIAHL